MNFRYHLTARLMTLFTFIISCHQSSSTLPIKVIEMTPLTNSSEQDPNSFPVFNFVDTLYDFGTVNQGQIVEHDFKFKNIGKKPLVIKDVKPSCGCTVADFSRDTIKSGDSGNIHVYINTKENPEYKTGVIGIMANTSPEKTELYIKMEVKH